MTHSQKALGYARDVVAGRIIACRWVILACERHLNDLKRQDTPGFPYAFDEDQANRACQFKELLPHVKGEWAGQLVVLEPWQCFVNCSIFGWIHAETGYRRFRKASVYVPRKNGKSFEGASTGDYMFAADGEPGAEVYSGAATEAQAWEVFRPARQMVKRSDDLIAAAGIEVNAKSLVRSDGSRFVPIVGKPGDGSSPHCAIVDEYHEHQTSDQYDTMLTGMGARRQPLMFVISTAGDNIEGPCYDDWRTIERILEGTIEDEQHFGIIYTIDADDDWTQPEALEKANPNIGVSVSRDFLLARQREAVQNARHQYRFQIKHLNIWVASRSAFYNTAKFRELGDPSLTLDSMKGRGCYIALDLASKVDIAAVAFWFPPLGDEPWTLIPRFYLPEDVVDEPEGERYRAWAADGHIILTDEKSRIDLQRIQDDVIEDASRVKILGVGHDPWQSAQMAANLAKQGLEVVEYRQTVQMMSEPMKDTEALILSSGMRHDGNPVMSWMIGNVTAKIDAKDNVYPRKEREKDKIDGPVAWIMANGMALREETTESVYETRGMRYV